MNLKYIALVLCIALIALLIALAGVFYYQNNYLSKINLKFHVDEAKEPIEGDVYLNNIFLGSTRVGVLSLKKENINSGVLNFVGKYHGRQFNFSYDVYESDIKKHDLYFIVNSKDLNSFTLNFYINETQEPLNGSVYMNSKYLGETQNGKLKLNISQLFPGTLTLNGTYQEKNFEFQFNFKKESLGYFYQNSVISQQRIKDVIFDASKLNASKIEIVIFDLANIERERQGIKKLKWNKEISDIARNYSEKMTVSGFHHTDIEGKDIGDRLKDNNIFYLIVLENLHFTGNLNASADEYYIGKTAVEGWLKSPGHRTAVLDRDELCSDAGVGVYCKEKYCYVTMDFIGFEDFRNYNLKPNQCLFDWIYHPSYPFDFDVKVNLQLNATKELNVYVVSDKSEIDNCLLRRHIDSIKEYKYTKKIDDEITIKKGYGLLLEAKEYTSIPILIDYYP